MLYRVLLVLLLVPMASIAQWQSPAAWWYFGDKAGVHWETTGPVFDLNGEMSTLEGCAAVSSGTGDLQFYTDGTWVWDSTHNIMPNGDSLLGNASSTQSAVIVPYPGTPSKYYIFAVRGCTGGSSTGVSGYLFSYSVVDMTLNGGLGDVDTNVKNIILFDSASEKCTAVPHANGSDIWIIGHEHANDRFHAFQLSSSGIVDTVVTDTGAVHTGSCAGYLIGSHVGDKLAVGNAVSGAVELFDFDQATGIVGASDTLTTGGFGYGVHFSPNDEILYVGAYTAGLFQFDLTAPNIQASQYQVTGLSSLAIAEGPDEKLYSTRLYGTYIQAVHDPNVYGAGCNYEDSAVYLGGQTARYGLPNNVSASVFAIANIQSSQHCVGDSTYFTLDTLNVDSVKWNFGDPTTGAENTSTLFNPSHLFSDTGYFTVMVVAYSDTVPNLDTAIQSIFIFPRQELELGDDTSLCNGDTLTLDVTEAFSSYIWSTGQTSASIDVSQNDTLSVTLRGVCDTLMDTIIISFDDSVEMDLGLDTTLCGEDSFRINSNVQQQATIFWSNDSVGYFIDVFQTGTYTAEAENACGQAIDSIFVELLPIPDSALLPDDTINCFDREIVLTHPDIDGVIYTWSDSSSKSTYKVDTTETIWLAAENECGLNIDTINIIYNGEIQTELGEDTTICEEDSLWLVGVDTLATYVWNTGQRSDSIYTSIGATKNYVVTITWDACQRIEQRYVTSSEQACPSIDCEVDMPNTFSPNGDGVNDLFRVNSNCVINSYDLAIYNRWGQMIHYSRNAKYGWDGFVNGIPAQPGTYFYRMEFRDQVVVDVDRMVFEGSLTLHR